MTIQITYEWLISQGACYWEDGESKMGAWVRKRLPMSIETLQRSRKVPPADKMWVLYRLMSDDQLCLFARCRAWSVVGSWDAPAVVKEWLLTGDEASRSGAYAAARSAARSASRSASRSAAYHAAYHAAYSADLKTAVGILNNTITEVTQ